MMFFILFLLLAACILTIYVRYLLQQSRIVESALHQIDAYLDGDMGARINCDYEEELYRLFHEINTMTAVLSAHAVNGTRNKGSLKSTLSDTSHQLKAPLVTLNIYNGLLQNRAEDLPEIKEFAGLSEQEIDRIETLVQNLFKVARLDAGTLEMEKAPQNVPDMMNGIEPHFFYRTKLEHKRPTLSRNNHTIPPCNRDWLIEAVSDIVKNVFDHTKEGDSIQTEWEQFASIIQIKVKDTGCGIHPENLHHIFERFYRSRFLQNTQDAGLDPPLVRTTIKAHDGTVEVGSALGAGITFRINLLIPTKLQSYSNITARWRWQPFGIIKERSANNMNLLEVQSLSKTYGTGDIVVRALKAATFSVPKGGFAAIVGGSGPGESTLLSMPGVLDAPTSGEIFIDGKNMFFMQNQVPTVFRHRSIGFIFQSFNLILELAVKQDIISPILLDCQKSNKKYLEELLTALNLRERWDCLPNQLSGGQQQRVAIGRALITRPSLILADKPTDNLDTQNTSEVISLLKDASKKYEQTIIVITHSCSIV